MIGRPVGSAKRGYSVTRTIVLDEGAGTRLMTNDFGDYAILTAEEFALATGDPAALPSARRADLEARGLLSARAPESWSALERAAYHTRKAFALEGPSLHILVVTLRCDHSCQYCQVSRAAHDAVGFDMSEETVDRAVDLAFSSPAPALTIEFQGGEPALRFDLVRRAVERARAKAQEEGRTVGFAMVSTLHHLDEEALVFCRDHEIRISTSIDGSAAIHDANRPNPTRDAFARTIDALARARAILGEEAISALPTVTRRALGDPVGLVDAYRALGFSSIFLRPISPYGFARRTQAAIGYRMAEFLAFYDRALDHILALNAAGEEMEDTYAAILLRHILTPFHSGYLDLRSPAGAGLGTLVTDYDGRMYPSDEARMAAKTGDDRFALGTVADDLETLLSSPAMRWLAQGAIAERLEGCRDCAFVPYCGSDPVFHATVQGDPAAPRVGTDFCDKHRHLFRALFRRIGEADPETMRTFVAWAMRRPRREIVRAGWIDR